VSIVEEYYWSTRCCVL